MDKPIQKATFLTVRNKGQLYFILVMESKRVFFNFGDDNWFDVKKMNNIEGLKGNRKYKRYLQSKEFQKNIRETMEVIDKSENYEEIVQKFIKDFKKDRGAKIIRNDVELDTTKKMEDIKYEFDKK